MQTIDANYVNTTINKVTTCAAGIDYEKVLTVIAEDAKATDEEIREWANKLAKDMVDLEPEYSKLIDDNFWGLV